MKRSLPAGATAFLLISMVFIFSSCLKDRCTRTYNIVSPVYTSLRDIRSQVKSQSAASIVNTGKLYIRGKWIFLNELNKGIHVIDNSDPSHPVRSSFINIPGNIDLYTKGNTMYADMYCDLLAVNINDPKNISVSKFLTNTFPEKSNSNSLNADSIRVITSYTSRDTVVDCNAYTALNNCINCSVLSSTVPGAYAASAANSSSTNGMAGSMARFAAVDNYMYTVTRSALNVIDINDATNPTFVKRKSIGWDIETIFPYNNKLYIGAGSSMSVYDLTNPADPSQLSWSGHWCSHDPVIVDGNYAYVTLHDADGCNVKINQLEVYDLTNAGSPSLVRTYQLKHPLGLSKDGSLIFVCDDGLKIYDASVPTDLKLIKTIPGFDSFDVIASNGIAYVVGKAGLYQFDYSDKNNIRQLSLLAK